ncbi:MAG: Rho termination factor N-terminal domain-containing protein [bacterium]
MTAVYNTGINPVEAAGRVFPPRRTVDADLTERQVRAVRAHRRLRVVEHASETPQLDGLESMTLRQLQDRAAELGVEVSASARKPELVAAIGEHVSAGEGERDG